MVSDHYLYSIGMYYYSVGLYVEDFDRSHRLIVFHYSAPPRIGVESIVIAVFIRVRI